MWAVIPAGQAIGNYRILSKIGTGGMGVVYLAEHPLIGKKVALKVIHRDLATQREVVQRFFQEAWAVNKIGDDHIVEIHDFGVTPDGDHFYIMEFLDGQNLAAAISHQPLDAVRSLHIAAQIASALAAAHAAGVMHRDLKPDNIMLTTRLGDPDFVKLLDFGLAKIFINAEASTVKTAAGILLGTPQYMSPEACESRGNVDHRTDIYALGVLLFQMMTGVVPFDGESVGEVLVKQVTQLPPPPRGFQPSIPPSVEQIILRCLWKDPDKRFPTMTDLRAALLDPEAYLHSGPPIAPARALRPGEANAGAKTIVAQVLSDPSPPGTGDAAPGVTSAGANAQSTDEPPQVPRPQPNAGPDLAAPSPPVARTMVIPTPVGYKSRRSSTTWFGVLFVGLLVVIGGGLVAARFAHDDNSSTTGLALAQGETLLQADAEPAAGVDSGVVVDGGSTPPDSAATADVNIDDGATATPESTPAAASADLRSGTSPDAAPGSGSADSPSTVVVVIDSLPRGAEVIGAGDQVLGKTPAKLILPIGSEKIRVRLKLAGYHTRTKKFAATGNAVIAVPLDRISAPKRREKRAVRVAPRGSDDLERP